MESATATATRRSLIDEFAARGLRLTMQRRVLLEIIQSATEHLDAAALLERARLQESQVDRATVYRTLDLLKKHRLIDELDLMHLHGEKHYYELRTNREHVHLACFRCGRIEEFRSPLFEQIQQELSREHRFSVSVVRMEVGGLCSNCREDKSFEEQ